MPNPVKKGTDAQVEMNKFTVAREVLYIIIINFAVLTTFGE